MYARNEVNISVHAAIVNAFTELSLHVTVVGGFKYLIIQGGCTYDVRVDFKKQIMKTIVYARNVNILSACWCNSACKYLMHACTHAKRSTSKCMLPLLVHSRN